MDFRSLRTRFQLPDTMERMDGKESLKTILNLLMERTLNTLMTKKETRTITISKSEYEALTDKGNAKYISDTKIAKHIETLKQMIIEMEAWVK